MRVPLIRGVIDRRVLINYRIDPGVAARVLPAPFIPKLVKGYGIGGICLIRLKHIRPRLAPTWLGLSSENAAHRFAVEWDDDGTRREGVFIPRRDTGSRLNAWVGGRLFPGEHRYADFEVEEVNDRFQIAYRTRDHEGVGVTARIGSGFPSGSVFNSLDEASRFFETGSVGYSATSDPERFEGLHLRCKTWAVQPLEVESVMSSYFANDQNFPAGSVQFDCALLMRGVEHEWHSRGDLCCSPGV